MSSAMVPRQLNSAGAARAALHRNRLLNAKENPSDARESALKRLGSYQRSAFRAPWWTRLGFGGHLHTILGERPILCDLAMAVHVAVAVVVVAVVVFCESLDAVTSPPPSCCTHCWSVAKQQRISRETLRTVPRLEKVSGGKTDDSREKKPTVLCIPSAGTVSSSSSLLSSLELSDTQSL